LSVNDGSQELLHYNGQNRYKCEEDDDLMAAGCKEKLALLYFVMAVQASYI